MCSEMLGALMIIVVVIVVVVWQMESTLAGHGSQLASVIWDMFWVCQASLAQDT